MVKILTLWLLCYSIVYGANSSIKNDSMTSLVCNGNAVMVYSICMKGDECITVGVADSKRISNDTTDTIVNVLSYALAYKMPVSSCTLFTSTPITSKACSLAKSTKHSKDYCHLLENSGTITLRREKIK